MSELRTRTEPTYWVRIYMAGDIAEAKRICAQYCLSEGLCVTVTPTTFIYTGGREEGLIVELVNYPRFPKSTSSIDNQARVLADRLIDGLAEHSALIMDPGHSRWLTRRPGQ